MMNPHICYETGVMTDIGTVADGTKRRHFPFKMWSQVNMCLAQFSLWITTVVETNKRKVMKKGKRRWSGQALKLMSLQLHSGYQATPRQTPPQNLL